VLRVVNAIIVSASVILRKYTL